MSAVWGRSPTTEDGGERDEGKGWRRWQGSKGERAASGKPNGKGNLSYLNAQMWCTMKTCQKAMR